VQVDGAVTDVHVVQGLEPSLDQEAANAFTREEIPADSKRGIVEAATLGDSTAIA
jgi:hypothetical protein